MHTISNKGKGEVIEHIPTHAAGCVHYLVDDYFRKCKGLGLERVSHAAYSVL